MEEQRTTQAKRELQAVTCSRCGGVIARHEPLTIVERGHARRSTLAIEPRPPAKRAAIYHPDCYQLIAGQQTAGDVRPGERQRVFKEALCAVDGGEGSFAAVEQAAKLVGPGGSLTVLIVTSLRTGTGQMSGDSATELVDRANTLADQAGVSCRIEVDPAGPVHETVADWASVHDLLAIGAPPKSLLAGMLFSGVTDTAIRSLSTPLLIARPVRAAAGFGERMLVASDGLLGSDELVAFANRVARDGRSALTLIHALGRHSIARRSRIDAQTHSIQPAGADGDPPAVIESGSADDTIIAACTRLGASLVVMSSRRRSGLSALGSVSRRVVHHGDCSVLLVPPDWLARDAAPATEHA